MSAGFAAPLFPIAGPLATHPLGLDLGEAEVGGRRLPVPLNHARQHLGGLAYLARAEVITAAADRAHLRLPAGFFGPYWTGQVQLDLVYTLGESLRAEITAFNLGPTPVPIAAGVRLALAGQAPYERCDDGVRRGAIQVRAEPLGRVDLEGVATLSTGEFRTLEPDATFRFAYEITASASKA